MASRRPLQALRPLPQHCIYRIHPQTPTTKLAIRCSSNTISSSSTTTTPSALATLSAQQPANPKPRKSATWMRAVAPPKQHITWPMYAEMMQKPKEIAHRLAKDEQRPTKLLATQPPPPAAETAEGNENEDPSSSLPQPQPLDPTLVRLTPGSPSYFSTQPHMNDDAVHLANLARKHGHLPKIPRDYVPNAVWKTLQEYRQWVGEPVSPSRYLRIKNTLRSLNRILPELRPQEIKDALNAHLRNADPVVREVEPKVLDEWGRGFGKGRRKTSRAIAYVVEGSGEVLVNERNITDVFGRVRDRESALWPLTATGRMGRYNVFAVVRGGGTTGWAEAMALAVAKAVLVHEPGLKPAMRRAGVIRRDPRKVERKKPGHVKARKMPAWVKR